MKKESLLSSECQDCDRVIKRSRIHFSRRPILLEEGTKPPHFLDFFMLHFVAAPAKVSPPPPDREIAQITQCSPPFPSRTGCPGCCCCLDFGNSFLADSWSLGQVLGRRRGKGLARAAKLGIPRNSGEKVGASSHVHIISDLVIRTKPVHCTATDITQSCKRKEAVCHFCTTPCTRIRRTPAYVSSLPHISQKMATVLWERN